ncbi:hypothetical protein LL033_18065 [Clostridium estertheticum]|uniref:hypothetical protein n=1 Tax=Clostridium estertheticum TaxID=238834 RepID=UPI001C0D808E|nr:hypothetical protein [Clostridium estertheticum]MBU3216574.1 hypothetical protein [Clostridium estertheticum]WAG54510.1 hypothetical protein LL033_18065 [Clostridium estertheticum]
MEIKSMNKSYKKGWTWLIAIAMVISMATGCSNNEAKVKTDAKAVTESSNSKTTAPKSEVAKTEKNTIKTDAFIYAKKVDITDARDITKHVQPQYL